MARVRVPRRRGMFALRAFEEADRRSVGAGRMVLRTVLVREASGAAGVGVQDDASGMVLLPL